MRNRFLFLLLVVVLGAVYGCSKVEMGAEGDEAEALAFDIPLTLYERMIEKCDEIRAGKLMPGETFDVYEMFGLPECGFDSSNVVEIVKRPRGTMRFFDDLCTEEERRELWPFELEAFESTLEARMRIGEHGFQLVGDDGGLLPRNPTIRWFNEEMDSWAVKQLDGKFERMSRESLCEMFGSEAVPDDIDAWRIDEIYYFIIDRTLEGAWCQRSYSIVIWKEGKNPVQVADFDSFPNAKEAIAARGYHCYAPSLNNLAVLEWQHRSHRQTMSPWRIEVNLKMARDQEVPTADANLKVLYEHIPELTKEFN